MTPNERLLLKNLGESLLLMFGRTMAMTLLYGIFMMLFCVMTYITLKRGLTTYTKQVLFTVSCLNFLAASIYVFISLASTFLLILAPISNTAMPLTQRRVMYNVYVGKLLVIKSWASSPLPFLTDLVTIWRGALLFPEQRSGFIFALFLVVAGMGVSFVYLGFLTHNPSLGKASLGLLEPAAIMLSCAANLAATGLIAYNIWSHRRFLVTQLHREDRRHFRLYKILRLLVDSGLVYCVIQAVVAITQFLPEPPTINWVIVMSAIFFEAYIVISALLPSLVAHMIRHKGSFVESYHMC